MKRTVPISIVLAMIASLGFLAGTALATSIGYSYYGDYMCQETGSVLFPNSGEVDGKSYGYSGQWPSDSIYTVVYLYAPGSDPTQWDYVASDSKTLTLDPHSIELIVPYSSSAAGTWHTKAGLKVHWFNEYWSNDDPCPSPGLLWDIGGNTR